MSLLQRIRYAGSYLPLMLASTVFGVFYIAFTLGDLSTGFTSDDAVYLLLADLYSLGDGTRLPVYTVVREQALFPPLFPMLLGLFGGGSGDLARSSLITVFSLVFALSLSAAWIMQQVRNHAVALMPVCVLFLLPGTVVFSQEIWSEFLFMVWLSLIFLITGRDTEMRHHWLILSVLIALATLTRTAGVALIPPFLLLLYRRHDRRSWLPALLSTVPFLAWYLPREILRDSPGYTLTLASALQNTGSSVLEPILAKIYSLFESLYWLFAAVDGDSFRSAAGGFVLLGMVLIAGATFIQRLRALRFDALFCACYLVMILVWPYSEVYYVSRFIYPLIPLFLLYATLGVRQAGRNRRRQFGVAGVLAVSFLMISGPSLHQFMVRGYAEVEPGLEPYRNDRSWLLAAVAEPALLQNSRFIIETLREKIPDTVSEQDCLYAFQPPFVMLHTKRVSGVLPPPDTTDEQFSRETALCSYILALPVTDLSGYIPEYYPLQRLGHGYEQTVFHQHPETGTGSAVYLLRKFADTMRSE